MTKWMVYSNIFTFFLRNMMYILIFNPTLHTQLYPWNIIFSKNKKLVFGLN